MFGKLPLPVGYLDRELDLQLFILSSFSFVGGRQIDIPTAVSGCA